MLSTSASSQASNHPVHNRFDDSQMLFGIVFVPLPVSSLPIFIVSLLSTCQGSDSFCKAQECMANSFRNRWPGREAVEKFSPFLSGLMVALVALERSYASRSLHCACTDQHGSERSAWYVGVWFWTTRTDGHALKGWMRFFRVEERIPVASITIVLCSRRAAF